MKTLVMGVVNISPESFYKGSVHVKKPGLLNAVRAMEKGGADLIDVGAMSTAPYLKTRISEDEEARRLAHAVRIIAGATRLPVSSDTSRLKPALAAYKAGARILNDVTGLSDKGVAELAKKFDRVILMAHPSDLDSANARENPPALLVKRVFKKILTRAAQAGVPSRKIILDPGLGFFRDTNIPWWQWDLQVLRDLPLLTQMGFPLLVAASRKSFLSEALNGRRPEERLAGSLAAAARAVLNGAAIIRTHDVPETKDVIRILEATAGRFSGVSGGGRFSA